MKPRIELRIDELVLHGFRPEDRHAIGEAVERSLVTLLETRGVPARWLRGEGAAELDAGSFTVGPRSGPKEMGAQIARAIIPQATRQ